MTHVGEIMEMQAEEVAFQRQALRLKEKATLFAINDEADYSKAGEFLLAIKEHKTKIVDYFKPLKEAAHKAHKAITQRESEELIPVEEANHLAREIVSTYLAKQEQIRKDAQAKAEAEAQEKANKEREKLLKKAVAAESKGKEDKAEAYLERAETVYVAPVVIPSSTPKTVSLGIGGGVTQKKDIKVLVTSLKLLLKAVLDGKAPETVVEVKEGALKTWVKAAGISNGQIPGIIIEEKIGVFLRA